MAHLIFEQDKSLQPTLEILFQLKAVGLPEPIAELNFHPERKWRFDLAWPKEKIAFEIEGGIFRRKGAVKCRYCGHTPTGRHATGKGMLSDMEKYNAATLLGWRLLRVTPQMISNGEAIALLERIFKCQSSRPVIL